MKRFLGAALAGVVLGIAPSAHAASVWTNIQQFSGWFVEYTAKPGEHNVVAFNQGAAQNKVVNVLQIGLGPLAGSSGCTSLGLLLASCSSRNAPLGVVADMGDGPDVVYAQGLAVVPPPSHPRYTNPFTFHLGSGNDVFVGSPNGDSVRPGLGADLVLGLDGRDEVMYLGGQHDAGVRVSLDGQPNDGLPGEGDNAIVERVVGTLGPDVLVGDAGPNTLTGSGGADVLRGGDGDDHVFGESSALEAHGDGGNDYVTAPDGATVSGGPGNDEVWISARGIAPAAPGTVDAGAGDDLVSVSLGREAQTTIACGDGFDRVNITGSAPALALPPIAADCEQVVDQR